MLNDLSPELIPGYKGGTSVSKGYHLTHKGNTYKQYEELHNVGMKWTTDWWDGPLEGVAEYEGRLCYFFLDKEEWYKDEEGDPVFTKYLLLVEFTKEQLDAELEQHKRFEKYVRKDEETHPNINGRHSKFYDWYKEQPDKDFSNNKVIGYFVW
jgi:hypothetical protein